MYQFCLDFFISRSNDIIDDNQLAEFNFIQNQPLILKSQYGHPIRDSKYFRISANGFQTESEAAKSSELLEISLLVMGLKRDLGVKIQSPISVVSSSLSVSSPSLEENTIGLTPIPSPEFGQSLISIYNSSINVSDKKLKLGLELYNASRHEVSKTSEFLTLVMAMESLLKQKERSKDAVELVKQFKTMLQESIIDEDTKNSMLGSLKFLEKESINQGLQRLANNYLHDKTYNDSPANKFIKHCYNIRSKLVHDGETSETTEKLLTLTGQLKNFVSDFLIQKLNSTS